MAIFLVIPFIVIIIINHTLIPDFYHVVANQDFVGEHFIKFLGTAV